MYKNMIDPEKAYNIHELKIRDFSSICSNEDFTDEISIITFPIGV